MSYSRDLAYAELCQRTYDTPGLGDHFAVMPGTIDGLYTLCFRGTKTWREWISDFVAFPMFPIRTGRDEVLGPIHLGFLRGAEILRGYVAKEVAGRPFALCGHSLGGALATVMGGFLKRAGTPPVEIVTFGAPRAGTIFFAKYIEDIGIRQYVFGSDPVPHVPSNPPFIHARQPLLQMGHPLERLLSNHHITNYIAALKDLQNVHEPGAPALAS